MSCGPFLVVVAAIAVAFILPLAVVALRLARRGAERITALEMQVASLRRDVDSGLVAPQGAMAPLAPVAAGAAAWTPPAALTPPTPIPPPPAWPLAPTPPVTSSSPPPMATAPPAAPQAQVPVPPRADVRPLQPAAAPALPLGSAAGKPPTAGGGIEAWIGGRLLPWVAAVALAFAGAYLVKYSFEHGWISPPVRVALGVAFGLGLLGFSTLVRRSAALISESLAAAGIADLFASFLAAVHVYHLVPPTAGFVLLALTTAVAVALSLRQGVMVALLGLVGGFLTPALVQTAQPSARNLFGYLLLLLAGLLAVARRRRWPWLAWAAMAAALLWAAVWVGNMPNLAAATADATWLSLFLLALNAAASVAAGTLARGTTVAAGATPPPDTHVASPASFAGSANPGAGSRWAAIVAMAATAILLAATVAKTGYATDEWCFTGLLAAGIVILAWIEPERLPLVWIAGTTVAILDGTWGGNLAGAGAARFLAVTAAAGIIFAGGAWAAILIVPPRRVGPPRRSQPGAWAALAAAAGIVFFLIAYGDAREAVGTPAIWGALAVGLAALFLAAALPVARRRPADPSFGPAVGGLAVAVTMLVSLAVPIALGRESLAVAWALEVTALVWIAAKTRLPVLLTLARLLAVAALLGALFSGSVEHAAGQLPLLNEILFAYGVPFAALALAAWLAERSATDANPAGMPAGAAEWAGAAASAGAAGRRAPAPQRRLATQLQWAALLLLFLLVTLEVDQLFQAAGRPRPPLSLGESAGVTAAWLLLGWGLLRAGRAFRAAAAPQPFHHQPIELGGRLIILLGLAAAVIGAGLTVNPLWRHQPVGDSPWLNTLLIAYALPAGLAVLAAAEVARRGGRKLPALCGLIALILGLAWVSLEVRQIFHGSYLELMPETGTANGLATGPIGPTSTAERYAYSAAWVLYGVALLIAGISRGDGRILRGGSLAVMLLAVLKTFLYDAGRLSDLYRVLSFLGLGASLLLLAFLYQRFMLRRPEST